MPLPTAAAPLARLLIRAEGDEPPAGGRVSAALRLGWARLRGRPPTPAPGPLRVQVAAMHGRPLFEQRDLNGRVELPLPAGTYHITALQSGLQRRYTVTLEPGTTFELPLRGATDGP